MFSSYLWSFDWIYQLTGPVPSQNSCTSECRTRKFIFITFPILVTFSHIYGNYSLSFNSLLLNLFFLSKLVVDIKCKFQLFSFVELHIDSYYYVWYSLYISTQPVIFSLTWEKLKIFRHRPISDLAATKQFSCGASKR